MELTISVFAVIVAISFILNILFLSIARDKWFTLAKKLYSNPQAIMVISAAAAIILLYLILDKISITNIFAVMIFTRFLTMVSSSGNEYMFIELSRKILNPTSKLEDWFELFVWVFLALGVLYENWLLIINFF